MPLARRPSPLSDELFATNPAPVLLGATNNGMPLRVKNTFVDMPSGLTPVSMKGWPEPMMTAPAGLNKQMGFPPLQATPVPATTPSLSFPGETPPATPCSTTGFNYVVITPTSTLHQQVPSYAAMAPGGLLRAPDAPFPAMPDPMAASIAPALQDAALLQEASIGPSTGEDLSNDAWEKVINEAENDAGSDEESEEGAEAQPPQLRNPEDAPKPPPGATHPSLGSAGHAAGCCRRCCFFPRGRCANGYECEFCHYDHDKRKRKNKKKRTVRASGLQSGYSGYSGSKLAKNLVRGLARVEPAAGRQVFTVPSTTAQAPLLQQALNTGTNVAALQQHACSAVQLDAASLAAWSHAQTQPLVAYCQAAGGGLLHAQLQAAGQPRELLLCGGGAATAPTPGQLCGAVVVHNLQQPASHVIVLPSAMSQAASQGPLLALQPQQPQLQAQLPLHTQNLQHFREPGPPPPQSPRFTGGPLGPTAAAPAGLAVTAPQR